MRITHNKIQSTTTLSHQGETYDRDRWGGFDVPEHVAAHFLTSFPAFWREADPIPLADLDTDDPEADEDPGPEVEDEGHQEPDDVQDQADTDPPTDPEPATAPRKPGRPRKTADA